MDLTLRIILMIISLFVFISVIRMLIRQQLNESHSILWLAIAAVTLAFGFSPHLILYLAEAIGVSYAPTLLFLVSTLMLMLISFKSSLELSKMSAKLNEMAIVISILKEENNRLAISLPEDRHPDGKGCDN